jgi:hypothetical protein
MAKSKTAVANPADRIADLVTKRDYLVELRDLTTAAPRALAEAEADISKTVEMLAARCEPQVGWLAQGPTGFADLARQMAQQDSDYGPIPAAALMAWVMPVELAAALKRDLVAAYDAMPAPMTSSAKHADLARLQNEIAAVEGEISSTWRAAVDAGLSLAVPPVSGAVLIGLVD